jgi:uncharacterized protein (TIGR03067 family)
MKQSLLAALGGAALFCLVGCKGDADFSGVAPRPVLLPAEAYRAEITQIDRLVFDDAPVTKERRAGLAARLEGLAARVRASSPERFVALESLELRALAAGARSVPDGPPPERLRNEWMRLRSNLFDDRSWFARSAADLEAESVPFPTPGPDLAPATAVAVLAAPNPSRGLDGRWDVKEIYANGKLRHDEELSGAEWTFTADELVIRSPRGMASRYAAERILDDRGTALLLRTIETGAGPRESGWMIYQLSEDRLNVAFFDGLGARPDSFLPPDEHGKPPLLMVVLVPKAGAPK